MSKTSTFTTTRQDSFDSPVLQRVLEQEINGSNSAPSPLRKFRLGKLQIAGLFDRLKTLVGKSGEFLSTCHVEADDFQKEQKELADFASQVNKIADLLIRDHMKVVFVGQTSNGKSTVVNAMLYNRILPSGIGHTTNCFLSVEGSDSDTPHIIDGDIKQDISTLKQLASALHPEGASNESRCIRVFWPTSKCKLLGDDVILVDSPGLDLSTNVNQWIDDYCMDADVFVLVANAESTIRMAVSVVY